MNITPDQARELLDGARPGPWYAHTDTDDPDGTFIYDEMGHMCIAVEPAGSDYREADLPLAAAAPDLAQTISGMEWQIGVITAGETIWAENASEEVLARRAAKLPASRLVRRLVGPVEEVTE